MTTFMALDGETSFFTFERRYKYTKLMRRRLSIGGMAGSWKKLKTSNAFSLFIVC